MAVYVGVSLPIIVLAHMRRRSEARLEEIEGQLALAQARLDGLSEGDRPVEHGRRPRLDQQRVVACAGGLEVDLDKRTAVRNGTQIRLTHTEWRILSHLAANVGAVVTSGELEQSAFGDDRSDRAQHLRNCMLRLRRKVESDPSNPQSIITAHGIGYRLATAA